MRTRGPVLRAVALILVIAAAAGAVGVGVLPVEYRDVAALRGDIAELATRAPRETGAVNLVSAIYLGYRALDTLGETVALLLAVAAVAHLVERRR